MNRFKSCYWRSATVGLVASWLIASLPVAGVAEPDAKEKEYAKEVSVLFIGNSFTGGDNYGIWPIFSDEAIAAGFKVKVDTYIVGATPLKVHWEKGAAVAMVRSNNYDAVVLQSWPWGSEEAEFTTYIPLFAKAIHEKNPNTKVLLYMHGYQNDMGPEIQKKYDAVAEKTGSFVVPAARAWKRVIKERPDHTWYAPDGWHPGSLLYYLTAYCVFCVVFEKNPEGIATHPDPEMYKLFTYLERVAWEAVREYSNLPEMVKLRQSGAPGDTVLKPAAGREEPFEEARQAIANTNKPGALKTIDLGEGVTMDFVWIPATTGADWQKLSGGQDFFWMGSPETERFRDKDETRHKVKLTRGFWLGKYEVTQRQWTRVMGKNPAGFKNPDNPVEMVNWTDAQEFIGKLNANRLPPNPESRTPNPEPRTLNPLFRLPTEAEWEYACRAGATGVFCHADSLDATQANFNGNSPYGSGKIAEYRQKTTPAGSFKPNAWGLFDMHGNLWEWCADWYGQYPARDGTDPAGITTGSQRVLRGGCWYDVGAACRSAFRGKNKPDWRWTGIGFRLAMEGQ